MRSNNLDVLKLFRRDILPDFTHHRPDDYSVSNKSILAICCRTEDGRASAARNKENLVVQSSSRCRPPHTMREVAVQAHQPHIRPSYHGHVLPEKLPVSIDEEPEVEGKDSSGPERVPETLSSGTKRQVTGVEVAIGADPLQQFVVLMFFVSRIMALKKCSSEAVIKGKGHVPSWNPSVGAHGPHKQRIHLFTEP